jgi:hypothetical protein
MGEKPSRVKRPPLNAYSLHSCSYEKKTSKETITCNE